MLVVIRFYAWKFDISVTATVETKLPTVKVTDYVYYFYVGRCSYVPLKIYYFFVFEEFQDS